MSTANSKGIDEPQSFAAQVEAKFYGGLLPYVGVVRHFEGAELSRVVEAARGLMTSKGLRYKDAVEEIKGRELYTNVAQIAKEGEMNLWIMAEKRTGVGVLIEARMFHLFEFSAEANEYLARFIEELEASMLQRK